MATLAAVPKLGRKPIYERLEEPYRTRVRILLADGMTWKKIRINQLYRPMSAQVFDWMVKQVMNARVGPRKKYPPESVKRAFEIAKERMKP